jgi:TolB-like protein/DNA-binding winged helix-turn-helix (wHTH) protein
MERKRPSGMKDPFELGDLRVDPSRNLLVGPTGKTTLEPKVMAVLVRLAEYPGRVVERRGFTDDIWANEYGGDESLTRAVSLLRKALAGTGAQRVVIETVPRKGYRLVSRSPRGTPPSTAGGWQRLAGVGVLAVLLVALGWWWSRNSGETPRPAAPGEPVIAVLPFDSQTAIERDRFLAEGLADEILSALTRSRDVAVIAGNSSFRIRGEAKKDLDQLVRQLQVTHVVDGSVRRTDEGLRVGVHLVDAETGLVTWSNVLSRPEAKAYTIPPIVSAEVLAALGRPETSPTVDEWSPDPDAYALLLEARAQMRADPGQLDRIIPLLEEVVVREPQLAEAWAHLAIARLNIIMVRPGRRNTGYRNRDPEQRLSKVRSEAHRALALDSDSPEARLALAVVDYRARLLPLDEAERRFRDVVDKAPNHSNSNQRLGMLLIDLGRYREAVHYLRRAYELDPLSMQPASLYFQFAKQIGDHAEADRLLGTGNYPWWQGSFTQLEWFLIGGAHDRARGWLADAREAGYLWAHGAASAPVPGYEGAGRLHDTLERLLVVAESGDPGSDPRLPADLVQLAEDGALLHVYVAVLLGAAGYVDPVLELVSQRLAVDDLYIRGFLFREAFRGIREDPRVMAWFDAGTQLGYWLETDRWPDFCSEETLPYDCRSLALEYQAGHGL